MIFAGSRYEQEPIVRAPTAAGEFIPALYSRSPLTLVFRSVTYTVIYGDRFDILASRAYGDAELWWVLARANPEVFYPDDIPPGTEIRIPQITDVLPDLASYGDFG